MEHYGFVELKKGNKTVKPIVKATEFEIHAA
jgi:predicted transcriptional regulator